MKKNGFTKIDILILVGLIIIVGVVDIFVVSYFNKKERDIQILAEVNQIRSGLEVYLHYNNEYPGLNEPTVLNDAYEASEKLCQQGFKRMIDNCQKEILKQIPNQSFVQGNRYYYQAIDNQANYKLEFNLESDFKELGLVQGKNCADNLQIINQACF